MLLARSYFSNILPLYSPHASRPTPNKMNNKNENEQSPPKKKGKSKLPESDEESKDKESEDKYESEDSEDENYLSEEDSDDDDEDWFDRIAADILQDDQKSLTQRVMERVMEGK